LFGLRGHWLSLNLFVLSSDEEPITTSQVSGFWWECQNAPRIKELCLPQCPNHEISVKLGPLLVPGHLFGQGGVALGQFLEALVAFDGLDDKLQFIGSHPLAVVPAVLTALQEVVMALSHGALAALDLIGLLTDMAANHAVDVSHFFEDAGAFLLERS